MCKYSVSSVYVLLTVQMEQFIYARMMTSATVKENNAVITSSSPIPTMHIMVDQSVISHLLSLSAMYFFGKHKT
jgi:hypothetical protein